MELIKNFGLDPLLLWAQIINFLIIFYILKRFAYKPVLSVLKKREDLIKGSLKQAEESKKILEETLEKEKTILKNTQKKAEKIIEDAKNRTQEIARETEEKTRKQTEYMISTGLGKIAQESKELEKRIALKVSKLAIEFLQKSMQDVFGEKEQKQFLDAALKKIKKVDWYED